MSYTVGDLVEVVSCTGGHEFKVGETVRVKELSPTGSIYTCEKLDCSDWWYMPMDDDIKPTSYIPKPLTLTDIKQYDILEYKDDFLIVHNVYTMLDCITVTSIMGNFFTDGVNDFREEHLKDTKQVVCNLKDIFSNINI